MSFCKFSPGRRKNNSTMVDNLFITRFLPDAPDMCVKVYLLGLSKCFSMDEEDNNITYFSKLLNISEEDVISCFKYWESLGLVQVLSCEPNEVRYLPIDSAGAMLQKFKESEFTDFNIQAQELFKRHMLTQNDLYKFYDIMKNKHMEQNALITLIKYCIDSHGFSPNPSYVITIAYDWARSGLLTLAQVEARIEELGLVDDSLKQVLSAMGSSKKIQLEDKKLLDKWQNSMGFDLQTLIYVAKTIKEKKRKANMATLDALLTKYFENRLVSIKEIEEYEQNKDKLYTTAIEINRQLGLYYEDLSKEIDTYILPWLNMGFDIDCLMLVADNCFKSSIRTLEGLNSILVKLYKLGIINTASYTQYLNESLAKDNIIKEVLTELNIQRNVIKSDRDYYSIWSNNWGFSHEIIMYGASLSAGKVNAMNYLNKVLSNWHEAGVKTLEKAKATSIPTENKPKENSNSRKSKFIHSNYTKEQIASLITNLDEVEV